MVAMSTWQRQRFHDDVQRLRKLINRTPRWRCGEVDEKPVMIDDGGNVVLRFERPWASDLARLFTHLTYDVGIRLLALLEAAPGTSTQPQTLAFLDALRLDGAIKAHELLHGWKPSRRSRRIAVTSQITYPVSVKGVVVREDKVLLLRNERQEWELPGGRIEPGESPEQCVVREIVEETRWKVIAGAVLDSWMYYIDVADKNVFIVTYGCYPVEADKPVLSHEHKEIGLFSESEVEGLIMPMGYKRSIKAWFAQLRADASERAW